MREASIKPHGVIYASVFTYLARMLFSTLLDIAGIPVASTGMVSYILIMFVRHIRETYSAVRRSSVAPSTASKCTSDS